MKPYWMLAPALCMSLAGCLGGGVKSGEDAAPNQNAQTQQAATPSQPSQPASSPAAQQPAYPGGATSVHFALKAGNQPAACGSKLADIGTSHAKAQLTEGMIYVHDVALINEQGQEVPLQLDQKNQWQFLNLALLDFAGGSCKQPNVDDNQPLDGSNSDVIGSAPAGRYTGLSFKVGVPISAKNAQGKEIGLNHQPAHSPPHPILGVYWLMWEWQSGHRFMRVDLAPEGGVKRQDGSSDPKWAFHLGSTDCKPDRDIVGGYRCGKPNRFKVMFDRFNPQTDRVVLDIQSLFAGNDIRRDDSADFGCKSNVTDAECRPIFEQLGLRLNESQPGANDGGLPLNDGRDSRVFRLEKIAS